MPHTHFKMPEGLMTIEEALKQAKEHWDRESPYTYPMLKAMIQRDQVESFTPSKFYGCDRSLALKMRHDYAVDPANAFARLRGTMMHSILEEAADEDVLVETTLSRPINVDGVWRLVTGRTDLIIPSQELITDYKTTKRLFEKYLPKPDDIGKMKLYAWMAQAHGLTLTRGEIVYIEIATGKMLRSRILIKPADEEWIRLRVRQIQAVYDGYLPPVISAEESLWMCDYCDVRQVCADQAMLDGQDPPIGKKGKKKS